MRGAEYPEIKGDVNEPVRFAIEIPRREAEGC